MARVLNWGGGTNWGWEQVGVGRVKGEGDGEVNMSKFFMGEMTGSTWDLASCGEQVQPSTIGDGVP
jgi:hypothetical protein